MKYIVLFFCLLVVVTAFNARKFKPYQKRWTAFRKEYRKVYKTRKQLNIRKTNFMNNVQRIDEHNLKYNAGAVNFAAKITFFADMTHDEYKNYTGLDLPKFYDTVSYNKMTTSSNLCSSGNTTLCLKSLPDSVNWTAEGAVTRVRNQGVCPASWAFSSISAIESYYYLITGKLKNLSVQQLIDCSKAVGNQGCKGGVDTNAYDSVVDWGGVTTDDFYPYTQKDSVCAYTWSFSATPGSKLTGYTQVTKTDENELQMATAKGPVSVMIDAKDFMFKFYKGGVYSSSECSTTDLNHAALVVGYGTQKQGDYWLIKNSFGEKWGNNGYLKLARNNDNTCGIASHAIVPTIVAT